MGSNHRSPKGSLGVLKDIVGWGGEIIYFKENKPQSASHWKVSADTSLWTLKKSRNWIPAPFSEILQGNWHGPSERPRWECRPPTWAFVLRDRCSWASGWAAWALSPRSGCGEVPRQALSTGLPSASCSPICLRALVTSGNSFPLLSCVPFVGSSWSHPGAGWVWEEGKDSWDSLAGGLLAWNRAELFSHPHHSLPRPWFRIGT